MGAHFTSGNRITLLESGKDYFPALIAAIDAAQFEVHLETYIFEDDDTGRAVGNALLRAAQRGVAVRLLVDGFGSRNFKDRLYAWLTAGGVFVLIFRPEISWLTFRRRRLRRLHRKLAVIDAKVGFVGGVNIVNDVDLDAQTTASRLDYTVRIEGPLLKPLHSTAHRLWDLVRRIQLIPRYNPIDAPEASAESVGRVRAALVLRDNLRHRRAIENAYLEAIESATSEIVLANAYFFPGLRFRRALCSAAARGVSVRLILQGRVEYRLLHYASQALYGSLLSKGVRVFEYEPGFLHAKVAVIDGRWATVGSSNIDPFSLLMAREANVVMLDRGFARQLSASLENALSGSREVLPQGWSARPWHDRVRRWLAYGLVRLMIGLAGYRNKH